MNKTLLGLTKNKKQTNRYKKDETFLFTGTSLELHNDAYIRQQTLCTDAKVPCVKTYMTEYSPDSEANSPSRPSNCSSKWKPVTLPDLIWFSPFLSSWSKSQQIKARISQAVLMSGRYGCDVSTCSRQDNKTTPVCSGLAERHLQPVCHYEHDNRGDLVALIQGTGRDHPLKTNT